METSTEYLTLGQAAKHCGKAKGTLSRAIKSGKLSVHNKTDKGFQIDPAELSRVFPFKLNSQPVAEQSIGTIHNTDETPRVAALEKEVLMLREALDTRNGDVEDLRSRLDKEFSERQKLTMIITDMRPKSPVVDVPERKSRSAWDWLVGKGA